MRIQVGAPCGIDAETALARMQLGADASERDQVRRGELEDPEPFLLLCEDEQSNIDSSAVKGLVDPPSSRFQTATKAPGFVGVIRAVRIRHCSFPMRATPDS